jgi:hypothetical protein
VPSYQKCSEVSIEVSELLRADDGAADVHNEHEMSGTWSTKCHRVSDSHLRPRQSVWPETEYEPSFVNCRPFILFV